MNKQIRVVVVDDHPFFRDGICRGLTSSGRIEVVGQAADVRSALEVITATTPDVAVVDYQMPGLTGVDLVHAVSRDKLSTRVLLLSASTEPTIVYEALREGAAGYVSKDADRDTIIGAVDRVSRGETVVPPELAAGLVEQIRTHSVDAAPALSERERQVLGGLARGLSLPQIAGELYIGVATVKTHATNLYRKLGVSDRAAAVAEGMRQKLIE